MELDSTTERIVELELIQNDAESILSLVKTERDPIFAMAIMPYYALFIQSCQEYLGESCLNEGFSEQIKDIRNYIKVFANGIGKTKRRIANVDAVQDKKYRSRLRFGSMKVWNLYCNLGTYWTNDRHIIGNTQMYADCLNIEEIDSEKVRKRMLDLGNQVSSFISSVAIGIASSMSPIQIERAVIGGKIDFYYDLNTNNNKLFIKNEKDLSLFCIYLVSSINFVNYVLFPMFKGANLWLFRVEYIVTYYTHKALSRLMNYCENNTDVTVDIEALRIALNLDTDIFQSKFRNCMMHYGIQNQNVLSKENIEKPLFGMIETCFDGMPFAVYYEKLRKLETQLIQYLEGYFNLNAVNLKQL